MEYYIKKYLGAALFVTSFLVFTLWTLIMPHITLGNSPFFMFGVKHVIGRFDVRLDKQPLYFLLFVFIPALLLIRVLHKKEVALTTDYYFARMGNVLGIVNNYLFILSFGSVAFMTKTVRAPLVFIYVLFVVLNFALMAFENVYTLGLLENYLPKRDYRALRVSSEQKTLARKATFERIDAKVSTMYFFLGLTAVLGIIFFAYPLFTEMFTIPLGGDFTQQQIPFYTNGYDDWWHFLKTGEFPLWDANTFLGVNNIGSNSFYYAMNPFFLPILIFPRDLIPQGLSILMIGKFVLAAVTMRLYLKYMGVKETEARIFAIMFAFSGWNAYYLWFNHFMEVAVVFPLIFLGIEKLLKEKKITLLILSLGLMGFANYFFLMTVAVIGVLYAGFRYFQLLPKVSPSIIGLGVLAFALGILVSSVVLFPSLSIALNSDRVTGATYLDRLKAAFNLKDWKLVWEIITKWENQRTGIDHKKYYPLISYFFPVLSNRSVALLNTSSYDNTISSLFSFSPVILLFIPAMFVSAKKKKYSHFIAIGVILFMLFTPFFYNLLHGFTNEYGRWQLIVPFGLITYVALSLPEIKASKPFMLDLSLIINLFLMAITVKIAFSYENKNGFSYMYEREYIVFYQFIMLFATYLLFRFTRQNKNEPYMRSLLIFLEIAVMGTVTMIGHGFISYKNNVTGGLASYNADVKVTRNIQSLDDSFYRIYNTKAVRGNDNLGMRVDYNGLSAFHSLYNFELMDFNNWSRVNYNRMGWSLGIYERRSLLYDFLQVKYYVINDTNNVINWSNGVKTFAPYRNIPNTYTYSEELSTNNRDVYKVRETFSLGFGVDYALTYQRVQPDGTYLDLIANSTSASNLIPVENEELYLQTALLSYDDLQEVLKKASHLGSETYNTFPRASYTKSTVTSNLKVSYYSFDGANKYPFLAQLNSMLNWPVNLPTPEYIDEHATTLTYNAMPRLLNGSNHVIEYTMNNGNNILDGPGEIIINLPLAYYSGGSTFYNYRYRVFLYDENYEMITFDDHQNILVSSDWWKTLRSFHSPKAVRKIALVPMGSNVTKPVHTNNIIYAYDQDTLDTIRGVAISNTLEDVTVSTNKFTFKTNYDKEKFVVTTIPYDAGWKVVGAGADGVKVNYPVYRVQGGFAGFLSAKGATAYTMAFTPEYFNIGLLVSVGSLLITALLAFNARAYNYHKRLKKLEEEVMNA